MVITSTAPSMAATAVAVVMPLAVVMPAQVGKAEPAAMAAEVGKAVKAGTEARVEAALREEDPVDRAARVTQAETREGDPAAGKAEKAAGKAETVAETAAGAAVRERATRDKPLPRIGAKKIDGWAWRIAADLLNGVLRPNPDGHQLF